MGTKNDEYRLTVYFLKNPYTGLVKIGKTVNFNERYSKLCTEEGCKLEILLTAFEEDTEGRLHHKFKADRVHHEWFNHSETLEAFIQAAKQVEYIELPVYRSSVKYEIDYRFSKHQASSLNKLNDELNSTIKTANTAINLVNEFRISSEYFGYSIRKSKETRKRLVGLYKGNNDYLIKHTKRLTSYATLSGKVDLFVFKLLCHIDGYVSFVVGIPGDIIYSISAFFD